MLTADINLLVVTVSFFYVRCVLAVLAIQCFMSPRDVSQSNIL